jgi:hypothetical protein
MLFFKNEIVYTNLIRKTTGSHYYRQDGNEEAVLLTSPCPIYSSHCRASVARCRGRRSLEKDSNDDDEKAADVVSSLFLSKEGLGRFINP